MLLHCFDVLSLVFVVYQNHSARTVHVAVVAARGHTEDTQALTG